VVGGRLADKVQSNAALGWMLLLAGVAYCLLPVVALRFMIALGEEVATKQWGSLVAASGLFLIPSLLLGAVSPMLVRLVFVSPETVGRTTGMLYAVGSIGNVLGILVSDYVLLKYFDQNHNIWAMGVVLIVLGIIHLIKRTDAVSPEAARVAAAQNLRTGVAA